MNNEFQYGSFRFEWHYEEADLKQPTVTVEKGRKVLVRGRGLSQGDQREIVRKKARWIREKTKLVNSINEEHIVSGSRIKYLGRRFMVVFEKVANHRGIDVDFQNRQFKITIDSKIDIEIDKSQESIKSAIEKFYRSKFDEKVLPRIREYEEKTALKSNSVKVRKFPARWASCDADRVLEFHPRILELAPRVIDYVIVHELCHIKEKSHNKRFWDLVELFYPEWRECHERLEWDV